MLLRGNSPWLRHGVTGASFIAYVAFDLPGLGYHSSYVQPDDIQFESHGVRVRDRLL